MLYRAFGHGVSTAALAILIALFGISALEVALFNGSTESSLTIHTLFALLAFTAGGLAAIAASAVERSPLRFLSMILGVIALAGLILNIIFQDTDPLFAVIGSGGAERWVVYPSVLWLIGFGGYLMGFTRHS